MLASNSFVQKEQSALLTAYWLQSVPDVYFAVDEYFESGISHWADLAQTKYESSTRSCKSKPHYSPSLYSRRHRLKSATGPCSYAVRKFRVMQSKCYFARVFERVARVVERADAQLAGFIRRTYSLFVSCRSKVFRTADFGRRCLDPPPISIAANSSNYRLDAEIHNEKSIFRMKLEVTNCSQELIARLKELRHVRIVKVLQNEIIVDAPATLVPKLVEFEEIKWIDRAMR